MEDESRDKKLKEAMLRALKTVKVKLLQCAERGILYSVILGIAQKKSGLICQAESVSQLKEILNPPEPYWTGGEFRPGPYLVPEEELLMWSELSLDVVLNEAGYKRYEQLFTELFPEKAEEIFGRKAG